jgi:hypothetical protein
MKRRIVLIASVALIAVAALPAQGRKLMVWDMPNQMPGVMIVAMDLSTNIFVGTYSWEPYLSRYDYGVVQGTVDGVTMTGKFYQLGWDGSLSEGDMTMSLIGTAFTLHIVCSDLEGNLLGDYKAPYRHAGTDDDLERFTNIKQRVQDAINQAFGL